MNLNYTLIGQSITFMVFVWFCYRFIWPPLMEAMRERQRNIAAGLESAERAEKDLGHAIERAAETLREAKHEAQQIIDQARAQAAVMIEEAKADARIEGERVIETANAQLEQDVNRAKEALRGQVALLAVSGAERILETSIDGSQHSVLLDKLAAEL